MSEKKERIRPTQAEMEKNADELFALIRGEPGPYLETESSFFGVKRVDPSMKDRLMETDCGGMIITKSKLTYGQADELAAKVDLSGFLEFLSQINRSSPYWEPEKEGKLWKGSLWWVICCFLVEQKLLPKPIGSYSNSEEYLYEKVLKRLVNEGTLQADPEWRYFQLNPEGRIPS